MPMRRWEQVDINDADIRKHYADSIGNRLA
jgi:hypothetical protein